MKIGIKWCKNIWMRGASKVPSIRVNAGRKFGWMRGASVDAGRNGVCDNQVSWMRDASTDAWRIGFQLESERDWNVAVILGIGCVAHPLDAGRIQNRQSLF